MLLFFVSRIGWMDNVIGFFAVLCTVQVFLLALWKGKKGVNRFGEEPLQKIPKIKIAVQSLFSARGRMGRFQFLITPFIFFAFFLTPLLVLSLTIIAISAVGGQTLSYILAIPIFAFLPIAIVFRYVLTVRRLHDLNFSGYWVILIMASEGILEAISETKIQLPIILELCIGGFSLFSQLALYAIKGTNGPNRFGDDPVEKKELAPVSIPL